MNDNSLFTLIFSILNAGFTAQGQTVLTQQANQPTQEGINVNPTVYVYKVSDQRMGWPQRASSQGAGSASFTGSITGNVLTASSVTGTIAVNQQVSGSGLPTNLVITAEDGGTGGAGSYLLNYAPGNVASEAMTSQGAQIYVETQQYITQFQASALATQNPTNTESLTASDILNIAAQILQSGSTISTLESDGIGILAISDIRNPYFSDDRERYEASPSFDFSLTHKQIVTTVVPVVTSEVLQVLSV